MSRGAAPTTRTPRLPAIATTYRARLLLAIVLAVSVALFLVLFSLPRLLDGYFADQERTNLRSRTDAMAALVATQLAQHSVSGVSPGGVPIVFPDGTVGDVVERAFGSPESGFIAALTPRVAMANVTVHIASDVAGDEPVYEMTVPLGAAAVPAGQEREDISASSSVLVPDIYWTQTPEGAPLRRVTVTLSDPFTVRAQTSRTIAEVLLTAALIALIVAVITAIVLAQWLARPLRRLTNTSRLLAEGHLGARVSMPPNTAPEVQELARAFNDMADRLEESVAVISEDRDRGRDFLADVSHELRTPIAALRTFNELLLGGAASDPATRTEFLEQSARQVERLDWLAANLLELSKLDSGLVSLDLRDDDLRGVATSAFEQAEPMAQRKGIDLVLSLPDEPVVLPHDPPRLGHVMVNLIGNAIKFTPGGGRVEVELRRTPDGAQLVVRDTGVGIAADELPHVFDRFYRGNSGGEERAAGSGLGLSIVRSIVDMHQGRVSITSTPASGTEVVVELPADVSLSSPAHRP